MDFTLTEEQKLLIDTTKSFVKNELMQHEDLLEKTNNLPKELYNEIKKKSYWCTYKLAEFAKQEWFNEWK